MDIAAAIFYLISCISLMAGLFWFPRTDKRENVMIRLTVVIVFYECWTAFVCGLFSLIHIYVSLLSAGIANIAFAAAISLICLKYFRPAGLPISHKSILQMRQRFSFQLIDLVFAALLAVFLIFVWQIRFGGDTAIIYGTIDPVDRFSRAIGILADKTVIGPYPNMYFGHITNALFIGIIEPFSQGFLIRAFEIKELINVWLAGMLFYSALRQLSDKRFTKIIFFVLGFAYTLGFPWNNELWGFGYLGGAVSMMGFVVIGAKFLTDEGSRPWIGLAIISAGCLGVGLTYTMFAPPVFIAAFIAIWLWRRSSLCRERHNGMAIRSILSVLRLEILVFAVPALFTLAFTVLIGRGDAGSDLGSQFMAEGAIYRNLYGDFLIWMPLALFAAVFVLAKRKWNFPVLLAFAFFAFQAYFLARMANGTVSTYYYYKLNFGTWFIVLFLAGLAVSILADTGSRRTAAMIVCYFLVFGASAFFTVRGSDYTLYDRNKEMNPIFAANGLFGIYNNNNSYFNYPEVDHVYYRWDFIELCEAARKARLLQDGAGTAGDFYINRVEIVSNNFQDAYWADALVHEHIDQQPVSGITSLPAGGSAIWIVLKDSELYKENITKIDIYERLFENDLGFVVLISDSAVSVGDGIQ